MVALSVDKVTFDTPYEVDGVSLKMAVNRYFTAQSSSAGGVTLILAHASGTHKEHWEPVLQGLFEIQESVSGHSIIREAWAFDWHTHGDSAVLNAETLDKLPDSGTSITHWAEAIATFVEAHLATHRLVAIGHSAGTTTVMYSTKCYNSPSRIRYEAIILVEPPMIDRDVYRANFGNRERQINRITKGILAQSSKWDSRSTAYEYFSKSIPWKDWDKRLRMILVDHGLRPIDASSATAGPVTTKCQKRFEASIYLDLEATIAATEQIETVCSYIPIHVIFGEKIDLIPRYSQDSVVDISKGRNVASVTRIPGAGHMVVQQQPDRLAKAIYSILSAKTATKAVL
ncbi:alpha/beta-hydrolase [Neolentinus lepideus HHB14362 ss-1]|uniref:Alpha/beta-hydrolase n=1 Tax=Neolentinus lepideus HHB14362 ss-1 TaxID=1314782 RepID=A0A165Q1N7_9AGAM|nr:alpha/beta-hydrolase [Neolentinus lepideus HHB14362 ss-1]